MSDASADARANYENTKKTAPVPPGWMVTEPQDVDPNSNVLKFWNPLEQCWLDLQIANPEVMGEFQKFYPAGATCIIVRDPNYVAPPPPPMPTFGANLPFATPSAPVSIPAIPQAQPTIPVIPQVQAAPVIPVAIPVIPPQAQPVVQIPTPAPLFNPSAPMLPTPTLGLPAEQAVGLATGAPTFAPIPVATEEDGDEDSGNVSAADPNEVSAWLIARDAVKAQIEKLEEVENELRTRIVKTCFPDGLREGANKCALPDGRKLTITGVVNRTVDDALVQTGLEALQRHLGVAPVGLFKTKYEVSKAVLKTLNADAKALLANVITEKKGSPQLKVSEAK